jgi:hypothetical protein
LACRPEHPNLPVEPLGKGPAGPAAAAQSHESGAVHIDPLDRAHRAAREPDLAGDGIGSEHQRSDRPVSCHFDHVRVGAAMRRPIRLAERDTMGRPRMAVGPQQAQASNAACDRRPGQGLSRDLPVATTVTRPEVIISDRHDFVNQEFVVPAKTCVSREQERGMFVAIIAMEMHAQALVIGLGDTY